MLMCFILGIGFLWFSHHKGSYEKTAEIQGEEIAKKKFRMIKICGFFMLADSSSFCNFYFLRDLRIRSLVEGQS